MAIREYSVIYTLVEEIEQMLTGMLEPRYRRSSTATPRCVRRSRPAASIIAGCVVTDGVVHRRDRVRVQRKARSSGRARIASLQALQG